MNLLSDELTPSIARILADGDRSCEVLEDLGYVVAAWSSEHVGEVLRAIGVACGTHAAGETVGSWVGSRIAQIAVEDHLGIDGRAVLLPVGTGSCWVGGVPALTVGAASRVRGTLLTPWWPAAPECGTAVVVAARRGSDVVWAEVIATSVTAASTPDGQADLVRYVWDGQPARVVASGDVAATLWNELGRRVTLLGSAELSGIACNVLDRSLDYVRTRTVRGRPIGSLQAVKHRCAELYTQVTACEALVDLAALALDGASREQADHALHAAKGRTSAVVPVLVEDGVLLHGAIGFTAELGFGALWRRAVSLAATSGTADQHRRLLATAGDAR